MFLMIHVTILHSLQAM